MDRIKIDDIVCHRLYGIGQVVFIYKNPLLNSPYLVHYRRNDQLHWTDDQDLISVLRLRGLIERRRHEIL